MIPTVHIVKFIMNQSGLPKKLAWLATIIQNYHITIYLLINHKYIFQMLSNLIMKSIAKS